MQNKHGRSFPSWELSSSRIIASHWEACSTQHYAPPLTSNNSHWCLNITLAVISQEKYLDSKWSTVGCVMLCSSIFQQFLYTAHTQWCPMFPRDTIFVSLMCWPGLFVMLRRRRPDTTAPTWCSSTVQASWRLEERRAGWAAWSTLPPNSAACKRSTSCWHTDPGLLHCSTSRSDTSPICPLAPSASLTSSAFPFILLIYCTAKVTLCNTLDFSLTDSQ